jgi:hypothetical protein
MVSSRITGTLRLAVVLAVVLAACFSPTGERPQTSTNIPIVAASGGGVGFTVVARDFTFDQSYAGPAQGDTVAVGLVVASYGGGSAQIEIIDANGVKQLQLPVTNNVIQAQGQSTVRGTPPYTLHVQFTRFTGTFVLGVGVSGS